MINIEVKRDGVEVGCHVAISGEKEDARLEMCNLLDALEMCNLLDALESNEVSREYAIDYRINSLIEEYKELEDDGEL